MFSTAFFTAAACGLFASSVNAHMVITSPVPYGADSLNNSPLEADGSDFPCKQRSGVYDVTKMNTIPVGVPQELSFKGGATHGGGSCQLSVTMDKQPTKSSKWKVVHSILGGCPNGASGNADGSPTYASNPSFQWSMPQGMPNGEYTLAWTWFNKIGNREMYMNCAPITVTGGADNDDTLNSLPDMFIANIPTSECETVESEDLIFPNPGKYVETAGSALGTSLIGACTAGKAGSGGSDASPTSYGGGSGSAPASSSAAPTGYNGGGNGSGPGGVVTVTTMATVTGNGPAPTGYSGGSGGSGGSGSGSSGSGGSESGSNGTSSGSGSSTGAVACSTNDEIMCMGDKQFGICDNGYARPMALAAGTSCSGGVISRRDGTAIHLAHLKRRMGHRAHRRRGL
ncbi:hypothetical protein HII31_12991 [Pseudocercospora fuligena]|uniref:Lytic polysaccharide monooxygenase n=1 Tax=Pseudocercospora fuligena TaxID=685502 RepID=A0A8H6VBZ2_9PEZI|nr:hypothetical protein HII31_12991 [Pseudocercospora fuligena]